MRRIDIFIDCKGCDMPFKVTPSLLKQGRKCCSHACSKSYLWSLPEYRDMQSKSHKGRIPTNIEWLKENAKTLEHRKKVSAVMKERVGEKHQLWGKKIPQNSGTYHYLWKKDRSTLKKSNDRNDSAYKEWRKSVRDRDGWKCRMSNNDCLGKVVAHHILSWAKFPDLRYEVSNGITLCSFHHPRTRNEEARLSPYFQALLINETTL